MDHAALGAEQNHSNYANSVLNVCQKDISNVHFNHVNLEINGNAKREVESMRSRDVHAVPGRGHGVVRSTQRICRRDNIVCCYFQSSLGTTIKILVFCFFYSYFQTSLFVERNVISTLGMSRNVGRGRGSDTDLQSAT